ncbi:hypothetical protein AN4199.2 [Aspergillus nidulans FGSC A4]|uniref:Integral membrane protein (AFU_orthologue AFUA_1G05950) n=1 Tax=Emericella nidulans (strain FGSC A4 / ATCC 38163 / CBS 112.46 / NRRL 194 / M139) TaxID=227321 RepID=Q5B5I1_EMENI|nr:hypothetical protein [Aspergillus nidulans FGSC A4]EAA59298.1 hypothetical protein AN4199.2 [Aspergillus nidulans FGSC A4]CBF74500.1 TPA: integral membrane protein (AFU_orthologue; AFUA_1G05950) [Aspergillus nidulans FGSC A4]|eukprot:XP_661803.1 hypothetical protein AN4199.2 [Aspergillus nidulans FGSC A4]
MVSSSSPGNGITGGYSGDSLSLEIIIATLAGITWYNAIELIALVFVTFSDYRGLYFWSLLISSSVGLIPYSLGFLLKFFNLTSATWLSVTFITIGWYCMVTGQAVVLYSRLHLVLPNQRILRRVLAMIIINVVILHVPTTVLTYGSNLAAGRRGYINGYNVMEKIQMTGFCIQEFVLSALYISETIRMLRLDPDRGKRKIMYQLVAINLIIILMDIGLLVVEYMDYYIMETMIKGVVYSVKLKLEFAVLGKLVFLVRSHIWKQESVTGSPPEFPDFVDATRVTSDLTHATPTNRQRCHPFMDEVDVDIAMFEHSSLTRESGTGHSDISHALSGETQTNNPPCSERDFTESSQRLPTSYFRRSASTR